MITLTPAYGRDYRSQKDVKAGLAAGHDFIINDMSSPHDGRYCSAADFKGQKVKIRYGQLRKVMIVQL